MEKSPIKAHATSVPLEAQQRSEETNCYNAEAIQTWLITAMATLLKVDREIIDVHEPFTSHGLSSREAVVLTGDLALWLKRDLSPTLIWEYPNIAALAQYLADYTSQETVTVVQNSEVDVQNDCPLAIIGLGCRFPGSRNPAAFWQLLRQGKSAISEVPIARWDNQVFYNADPTCPGKLSTRWGGFLEQIDHFDPQFFKIAPCEADRMDPQQRLVLEVAWEALEYAGIAPDTLANSQTGVFLGVSSSDYAWMQFSSLLTINRYSCAGSALGMAANRLSYLLDFKGPCFTVDTACSSSLVAVHLACQSLRLGEATLALAGGVNLMIAPNLTIGLSQLHMMAKDGRCKTFDAAADGFVRGEGCGIIVLKRLADAQRDGDPILALVRGSAINQDGRSNGLTAPNGHAQQSVIRQALRNAKVAPAQISYVEAHGTGTPLGDPIELQALGTVLQEKRGPDERCLVGAVKTNIGHLEAAAGIAGLIKTVLSLQHKEIPPNLNLQQPNPQLALETLPLRLPTSLQPWEARGESRLAGVSAFGFGGTNAHVILQEAPALRPSVTMPERPWQILNLSARSASALRELARHYIRHLDEQNTQRIEDICFTANVGRTHFPQRLSIVTASREQLQAQLRSFVARRQAIGVQSGNIRGKRGPQPVAFFFPGQEEVLYPGVARALYETQSTFRQAFDQCIHFLQSYWTLPNLLLLFSVTDAPALLARQDCVQPLLFALEYALCQLWRSWGVTPVAVQGCGVGEYVAACIAGVFSLEDGLHLAVARGQWLQQRDRSMSATEDRPNTFIEVAERISCSLPCLPLIASVTGRCWQSAELPTALYWLRQLQEPARTAEGLQYLIAQDCQIVLESGPGLPSFPSEQHSALTDTTIWLQSLLQGEDDWSRLLTSLAMLYIRGGAIDWHSFERDYQRYRIPLPTYPFERKRYWMTDGNEATRSVTQSGGPIEAVSGAKVNAMLQNTSQPGQECSPPEVVSMRRETILATLIEMAERVFRCDAISDTQVSLFALGADMLSLLALIREIERTFGIQLMLHQLMEEVNTLDALTSYLEQMLAVN